jgi:prophage regulatory protein
MTPTKILRLPAALERLGMGETSYRTSMADGLVPKLIPLGARAVGVPEHEINQVIRARIAGFSDAEIKRLVIQIHEKRIADAEALRAELSL